jgi:RNA polymerase sigma factor (sigma-70 family)
MGDDSCRHDGRMDQKRDSLGKKLRPDQPAVPANTPVPTNSGQGLGDAEICARYCASRSMTDEQRELAARYIPMAKAIAGRGPCRDASEGEELRSAAYMALVEAAMTFDPLRKVKFSVYARHRIRGAIRDCRRLLLSDGWRGDRAHRPIFQTFRGELEELGRVLGANEPPPVGAEMESTEAAEKWLSRLPRAHAAACRLLYLDGKSHDEAAALLGCSKSYLSRLHRDAISRLIQEYEAACESNRPADTGEEH